MDHDTAEKGRSTMITLFLIGDDLFIRHGLQMRLAYEPDITVIGATSRNANDAEILSFFPNGRPDVVVIDLVWPDLDGLKALAQIRTICPASTVIMLSLYDEEVTQALELSQGAVVIVGKREGVPALLAAIRAASHH